jgi:hypothetical protein
MHVAQAVRGDRGFSGSSINILGENPSPHLGLPALACRERLGEWRPQHQQRRDRFAIETDFSPRCGEIAFTVEKDYQGSRAFC